MKTTKKLLSVMLAVLMLTGCLGLMAAAEDPVSVTSITIDTGFNPYGGCSFPSADDYVCWLSDRDRADVGMVVVNEWVNGDWAATEAPFEWGKTYAVFLVLNLPENSSFQFTEVAPTICTVKDKAADPGYQYVSDSLATVGYSFTLPRVSNFIVLADPANGNLKPGDWYWDWDSFIMSISALLERDPAEYAETVAPIRSILVYKFDPESGVLLITDQEESDASVLFPEDENYELNRGFVKQWRNFIDLADPAIGNLNPGDWYFDWDAYFASFGLTNPTEEQIADAKASFSVMFDPESGAIRLILIDSVYRITYDYMPGESRYDFLRPLIKQYQAPEPTKYTVTANAEAGGSATGGGTFNAGATATVKATPNSGYHFTGWYKGGSKVSSDASYSFTVTENVTLTAKFEKDASSGDNGGNNNNNNQPANRCHWCGKTHDGNFFQKIIGWFHSIFAKIFGNKY